MLKEALEYLVSLAVGPFNKVETEDGRVYVDKMIVPIREPLLKPLGISTLTGFIGALDSNVGHYDKENSVVVVVDGQHVELVSVAGDDWSRRAEFIQANCEKFIGKFPLGRYMSAEEFIVGLMANFVPTLDLDGLLKVCSSLSAEQVAVATDDGISQTAIMRAGVVLKGTAKVKPRVTLAPYRTFPEIDQPQSDFIFRLKNEREGAPPSCALFEADGGRWEAEAMLDIQKFLAGLTKLPVIA